MGKITNFLVCFGISDRPCYHSFIVLLPKTVVYFGVLVTSDLFVPVAARFTLACMHLWIS